MSKLEKEALEKAIKYYFQGYTAKDAISKAINESKLEYGNKQED